MRRGGALALALALSLSGCTWIVGSGRDLGRGLSDGIVHYALKDSTRQAVDTLATRGARSIGRALGSELAPVIDSTIAGVLTRSRASLLETSDSLTRRLDGPLRQAATRAVRSAVAGGTAQLRADADPTIEAFSSSLNQRVRPVLVQAAGEAADTISARLARHVATDLTVAFETLTTHAARAADRASQESKTTKELRRTLLIAGGIAVLGLVLFGIWIWRDRRKARRSLAAVAGVINRPENVHLKPTIRKAAQGEDVEVWFNRFLAKNKLL